jgi:hypothetical protein
VEASKAKGSGGFAEKRFPTQARALSGVLCERNFRVQGFFRAMWVGSSVFLLLLRHRHGTIQALAYAFGKERLLLVSGSSPRLAGLGIFGDGMREEKTWF